MRVVSIPCFKDNYAYLVICDHTREAAIVDASEAAPVLEAVKREGVKLSAIWSTHHHPDHVGGNEEVISCLSIREVAGHVSDRGRIPGQTRFLETGDVVSVGSIKATAMHIPGHTLGAVSYFIDDSHGNGRAVFTGDTLFLAGCGRLFEGTAAQMHASFTALAALPPDTRVYCGHEYTVSNLKFAVHAEPDNAAAKEALSRAEATRSRGEPTVPSTIGEELAINPFLRCEVPALASHFPGSSVVDVFAAVRSAKDTFKPADRKP